MKQIKKIIAAFILISPMAANAGPITFNFFWTGDPSANPAIVSSTDATLMATGTVIIDAAPGSSFGLGDILSTNISVSGATINDFVFTSWSSAGGNISADGYSAAFSGMGNPFTRSNPGADPLFFGCRFVGCQGGFEIDVDKFSGGQVVYGSAADALASMTMTVPEPGTLVLLGVGLAGLGFARRKKA